ncbi:MAG: OmpA family protein [Bacteroidetes bacterium]|nr:MAG: OmpA family protein [Bacteroidota bacterium]TAG90499.1 MAG: OmpA family protein [Bacteroidota bacterium]
MHFKPIKDKFLLLIIVIALLGCKREQLPQVKIIENTPPEIVKFEAVPQKLVQGQQSFLQWELTPSASIKKIEINGKAVLDTNKIKGSQKIIADKSQDYELSVYYQQNEKVGVIRKKVNVVVENPFFRGEDTISIGGNAHIEWSVNPDATDVFIKEIIEDNEHLVWDKLPKTGNYRVNPVKNTRYELNVVVNEETIKYNHEIKVGHGFFTGTRTVLRGEEAVLIWQVFPNLKDVLLEEKENSYTTIVLQTNLKIQGNLKVRPKESTDYILALVGEHAQTRCKHRVEVVDAFFTGQTKVYGNEKATLTWRVAEGAKRIYITQEKNGEKIIIKDNLTPEGFLQVNADEEINKFNINIEFAYRESNYSHTVLKKAGKVLVGNNKQTEDKKKSVGYHLKGAESIEHSYMYDVENEPTLVSEFGNFAINFDFYSEKIQDSYHQDLDKVIEYMNKHTSSVVKIVGHSDLKGSSKGCLLISQKRAELAKKYLMSKGIPEHRLITENAGRTNPTYFQELNEEQARANRRVEISLFE